MSSLRYNVRTLLVLTTAMALGVLAAKPVVIHYVYPRLQEANLGNLLEGLLVLAAPVFTAIHASYFYLRCRDGVNRSMERRIAPPVQVASPAWGISEKLTAIVLVLFVLVAAIGKATKSGPSPPLPMPAESLTSIAVFGLLNAAILGWALSSVLVVPYLRCRFLANLTEEHFDYPGGPLLPWASLRSFTWQDRKQGQLKLVFPSNYYISPLKLIVPEDDIPFVDEFLRGKLDRQD